MSGIKLTRTDIASILTAVSNDLKGHADELRELDAAIGDGDLGVTIELGADAMAGYFANPGETDMGKMLARCGMTVNKANPSTFGTLLASAFMGAGKAVPGKAEITAGDLLLMGNGAVEGIKQRGKAEVGDKTMLDALVPAVAALQKSLDEKGDMAEALRAAVAAAGAGMQATAEMKARVGRGSYRQDGTVGVRDGGAVAMYYLIESFARHLSAALDNK